MDSLPTEILRRIVRYATITSRALDIAFTLMRKDDHNEISRSMVTKRSLSLVSKLFHELTEEFLFEIIRITDDSIVRPLVSLLREEVSGKPKRGWWCRRLELKLRYPGLSWNWGAISLWGLIPACPRLVDLRCDVEYVTLQARFPVSDTMLKAIASCLASTLRRLELSGQVTARFEDVVRMLNHLHQLESCRIIGLQYNHPSHPPFNDPCANTDPLSKCPDAKEREEYEAARTQAAWPSPPNMALITTTPVLPHLHTLHLSHFTREISKWCMPSLAAIGVAFPFWIRTPEKRANEVKMAITNNLETITSLTCYGDKRRGIDIWSLASALPKLESLEYHISFQDIEISLSVPLTNLHMITIFRNIYNNPGHNVFLERTYGYWQQGLLPALERIYVTGDAVHSGYLATALVPEFVAAGVSVESDVTRGIWVVDTV